MDEGIKIRKLGIFLERDKVKVLKRYIKRHLSSLIKEQSASPFFNQIKSHLQFFSATDWNRLENEMQDWKDEIRFQIAEQLVFPTHFFDLSLDENRILFGKLFLLINDEKALKKMSFSIAYVVHIPPGIQPLTFYREIYAKLLKLNFRNYPHYDVIAQKIALEESGSPFDIKKREVKESMYGFMDETEDNIQRLHDFTDLGKGDEGFDYQYAPVILSHINDFTQEECERLETVMWTWDEEMLHALADVFLEISNPFLDGYALYFKVIMKVNDEERLDYLLQNAQVVGSIKLGTLPLNLYHELREKIVTATNGLNTYLLDLVDEKIAWELEFRNNTQ